MTTTKQARYRQALNYYHRIRRIGGVILPPSITIAAAHKLSAHHFPLESRRQWKKRIHRSGK